MTDDKSVITEAAKRYGIDPKILWGLYGTETSFGHNTSTSSAGAVGPFQFLPSTAKGMGVNPNNFRSAAFGAARYLSQYRNRGVGGMLSAYNAGPGGAFQADYVRKTLENAKSFGSAPSKATVSTNVGSAGGHLVPGTPGTSASFDRGAFAQATSQAEGLKLLGKVYRESGGGSSPLFDVPKPSLNEFEKAGTPGTPSRVESPSGASRGTSSAYVNPHPGLAKGRTDMGVDFSGKPGTQIKAIGDAKVLGVSPDWFKGQPYVYYELLNGPRKGQVIYVAEQIKPLVKAGDVVRAGHPIGVYAGSGTGIEEGFGSRTGGRTKAQATTGYSEGQVTRSGAEFERFFKGLK